MATSSVLWHRSSRRKTNKPSTPPRRAPGVLIAAKNRLSSSRTRARSPVRATIVTPSASSRPSTTRHAGERGQAAVLVVTVAAALAVVMLVALASMGATSADRTRAQTAADAAALASVEGGRAEADSFAAAHGATVVEWHPGPGRHEVTVTVRLGDVTATARASVSP